LSRARIGPNPGWRSVISTIFNKSIKFGAINAYSAWEDSAAVIDLGQYLAESSQI